MPMMSSASGLRAAVPCRCLSMSDIPVYRLVDRIFMENIAEIERCEEQLREALLTSDVGLLDSLLGDDLIFTNQHGMRLTKSDTIPAYQSGLLAIETPPLQCVRITRHYGDTAHVCMPRQVTGPIPDQ